MKHKKGFTRLTLVALLALGLSACATNPNSDFADAVADDLRQLDIQVRPMGKPLTDLVQDDGWKVLSF